MSDPTRQRALWVSTSTDTRGGIATFVRTLQQTALWSDWNVRHVATHLDGSIPRRVAKFLTALPWLLYEMLVHRPDVVHIHMSSRGSFWRKSAVVWLAWIFRRPTIVHVHGSEFQVFYDCSSAAAKAYVRATLGAVDMIVALGSRWRERLSRIAPHTSIVVVPNATHRGRPVAQPAAGQLVNVLFLGRVGDRKGIPELLDAWPRAGSPTSPAHLTIAGDGDVIAARRTVAEQGIGDTVSVVGWVDFTQIRNLLERSHVLVLPSHNEGQPMAIIEAMSHGLCVIATDVGGIPDLIDDTCGVLIPVGDVDALTHALIRIIDDPAARTEIAAHGYCRAVEQFEAEQTSRRLDEIYRKLSRP